MGNNPRTTYLILDAFHSIPFQLIESSPTGVYEAPARFRARLTHNGTWNIAQRRWATPATWYKVSLYEGQLEYTFVAIREDVPLHTWHIPDGLIATVPSYIGIPTNILEGYYISSMHERPFLPGQGEGVPTYIDPLLHHSINPGIGMPFYGICTKITDRYGNSVNIKGHD